LGLNKLNLIPSICGLNFFNLDNFLGEVILCLIIPFSKYEVETNGYYPHFSSPRFPAAIFILIKTNIKIDNEEQQ
jgi:hypothetical protein